jgi:hypothetical protein
MICVSSFVSYVAICATFLIWPQDKLRLKTAVIEDNLSVRDHLDVQGKLIVDGWTVFNSAPSCAKPPTDNSDLVNKKYVDEQIFAACRTRPNA